MKNIIMTLPFLFVASIVFAFPEDPPLWGGSCDPEKSISINSPDFPYPISLVNKNIREQAIKMFKAKSAPYIEVDPKTGKESYRRKYQPQIDAASREVEEWERRTKDKVEKYVEVDPCPDGLGLIIRAKYLDLIW